MTVSGSCKNCALSRMASQLGGVALYCRANPPTLHMIAQEQRRGVAGGFAMHGLWPPVDEGDWCKHYEPSVLQS